MENGNGDEDEGRFRRQGWRTVSETRMEDGNGDGTEDGGGDEDGEWLRRRGRRTELKTWTEDGFGDKDGERGCETNLMNRAE